MFIQKYVLNSLLNQTDRSLDNKKQWTKKLEKLILTEQLQTYPLLNPLNTNLYQKQARILQQVKFTNLFQLRQ